MAAPSYSRPSPPQSNKYALSSNMRRESFAVIYGSQFSRCPAKSSRFVERRLLIDLSPNRVFALGATHVEES